MEFVAFNKRIFFTNQSDQTNKIVWYFAFFQMITSVALADCHDLIGSISLVFVTLKTDKMPKIKSIQKNSFAKIGNKLNIADEKLHQDSSLIQRHLLKTKNWHSLKLQLFYLRMA